jgi:actin-related protein
MGFASYARASPQALAAGGLSAGAPCGVALPRSGTGLVVDVGYSATHAVPVVAWRPEQTASRRLDVGGKLLTNVLKEALSYRQFNLMEDTAVVGAVKEALCFVAQDFPLELALAQRLSMPGALSRAAARGAALAAALGGGGGGGPAPPRRNPLSHAVTRPLGDGSGIGIRREYVLPDYVNVERGYVRGGADDPAGAGGGAAAATAAAAAAAAAVAAAVASSSNPLAPIAAADAAPFAPPQKRQRPAAGAADAAAAASGSGRKEKRGKKAEGGGGDAGDKGADEEEGEGEDGEEEEEEDDDEPTSSASSSEESDSGDQGEYRGSRKARAELAAAPSQSRRTSSRAAKSGVSALTAALRRDGVLAEGDEDSDGGGELEAAGGRRAALGVAHSAAALRNVALYAPPPSHPAAAAAAAAAQTLVMCAERISVPEVLFNPGDAGLRQAGLPAVIAAAIAGCAPHVRPALWGSIVLTGGGAALPGLEARLAAELRRLAPAGVDVALFTPQQPARAAWRGASAVAAEGTRMQRAAVTKQMWREEGAARVAAKLAGAEETLLG